MSEKKPTPKRVIAKAGATREELAEMLLQKWGIETVPGERFYNNPDPIYDGYRKSIKVTGSFDQLYINKGRSKKRIIDYGDTTNVKGIHKDLAAFLDKCGYEAQ
ncbi:MAG TPA: hypothetical protein VEA58_09370, partial [Anaerovoracaceae bacterium]|nr:hypothetical protein [Anaerovoracaceae bacterium]